MAQILVIEDEPVLARNICAALGFAGHEASSVTSGEDGLAVAEKGAPDLVLLDLRLPGMDGLDVLRELRKRANSASVIIMTAHGNIDTAVEAMKRGASDFLTKPLDLKALQLVIDRVLRHRQVTANLNYFRERERAESACEQIIGESEPMKAVKRFIARIVSTPALSAKMPPSVLITGETGTGKDLAARAIHYAGPRREAPFVHINCTALPEHLVEAELFGHVKGAFTDARGDKRGLFETADGGTVFLDEIGHMKPALQAKLLAVLQQRTIRPVGGTAERKIDVHVIAATNRDLDQAIQVNEFRDDLYHRLRVLTVHMPPLRERGDDLLVLTQHFVGLHAARFGLTVHGCTDDAVALLQSHDWPGNVRELSHVLESAVLVTDDERIHPEHLNLPSPVPAGASARLEVGADRVIKLDFGEQSPKLDEIENQIIQAALEHSGHNLSRAARVLGISRDAIRYRLEKFRSGRAAD
jgi:DNA-binding NtrC family response regulator